MKDFIALIAFAVVLLLTGCNTAQTLAQGVSEKSITASGMMSYGRVGLDNVTQTPEMFNLFIWGDYASGAPGSEVLRYEESEDASIFNSQAVSKSRKLVFITGDKSRMDEVISNITKGENHADQSN